MAPATCIVTCMLSFGCSNQFAIQISLPFRSVPVNEHTHTLSAHTLPTYLAEVCCSNCTSRCCLSTGVCLSVCLYICLSVWQLDTRQNAPIKQQFQYTRVSIRYKGSDRTAQRTEICFRFHTKQCTFCRTLNGCVLWELWGSHNGTACGKCWIVEGQSWRFVYHLPLDRKWLSIVSINTNRMHLCNRIYYPKVF
jgi:hypothetical protein